MLRLVARQRLAVGYPAILIGLLGPIIGRQFTASANGPLGVALSVLLLGIVLIILAVSWPLLQRHLRNA